MKKRRSRIPSLSAIHDADPHLLKSLMKALGDELKKSASSQARVVSFMCPNCDAKLGVSIRPGQQTNNKGSVRLRKSNFASGVNKVVLQLAKLRSSMTADIHRDFTKLLGPKASKISKEEYREKKLAWLRSEIAKFKGRRKRVA